MQIPAVPYRCSIYWKLEGPPDCPAVTLIGPGGVVRLNRTASFIWLLSDGKHPRGTIEQALRDRFPRISGDRIRQDLDGFLAAAEEGGFLLTRWDPLQPYQVVCERFPR
jgi:hypothetical protein